MRKALSVLALILALTCSAQAGYMQNGSPEPPPPQSAPAVQGPTTFGDGHTSDLQSGDVPSTDGDMQNGAATTFIQVVLNLLTLS